MRPEFGDSYALGSIAGDLGASGAAAGLAAVAKAALCLEERIIPGLHCCPEWLARSGAIKSSVFLPEGSQFWMRNRSEGPRRAGVAASNLGGNCQSVILEEVEQTPDQGLQSLTSPLARFEIGCSNAASLTERIRALAALARREPRRSPPGRLAFVYPGLGNQYLGMGRAFRSPGETSFTHKTRKTSSSAISLTHGSGGRMTPRLRFRVIASPFSAACRWPASSPTCSARWESIPTPRSVTASVKPPP